MYAQVCKEASDLCIDDTARLLVDVEQVGPLLAEQPFGKGRKEKADSKKKHII
jgi:hypothetical protein